MSDSEPEDGYRISRALEAIDREIRRRKRRQAASREEDDLLVPDPGVAGQRGAGGEDLRECADRFENAPRSTHARLLLSDGVSLPAPETLRNGEEVLAKLWEVINALAVRRVFIRHTNHLTDRELYAALWTVHLNEVTRDLSECPGSACHIDLLDDSGEENARRLFLRYYADAREREFWSRDLCLSEVPERCDPPYDRDRHLPKQGLW